MEVRNAAQAREWLNAWRDGAFELNRANRLAADMDTCAGLWLDRNSEAARGYREAAEVLRDAVARHLDATLPTCDGLTIAAWVR